jgi:alkylation response protein AidB-like acyl-CoA dehydrogenase
MSFVLDQEQTMLRDSARAFVGERAPVSHLRALRDRNDPDGYDPALWKEFAEMGFAGILVPEAHGGQGLGPIEAGIVMEEIGRTLAPTPFLSTAVLGATAISLGGSEAHHKRWLPSIASGELVVALASDESPKHRPTRIACTATRSGDVFVLDGEKTLVVDGHVAQLLIVAARTSGARDDERGITLFVVDAAAPGVTRERTSMVDAHNAARVRLDGVQVGADAVLGDVEDGWAVLSPTLDAGRAALACEMAGASEEAFARTLQYLKERRQFDKIIGEFQALQHRAAHLYCELELTRAAVQAALSALARGEADATRAVSIAKARAGASATLAVQEAVQMHGGIGMTDALDIGFFMKRVRVAQELLGDANFHADRVARLAGY